MKFGNAWQNLGGKNSPGALVARKWWQIFSQSTQKLPSASGPLLLAEGFIIEVTLPNFPAYSLKHCYRHYTLQKKKKIQEENKFIGAAWTLLKQISFLTSCCSLFLIVNKHNPELCSKVNYHQPQYHCQFSYFGPHNSVPLRVLSKARNKSKVCSCFDQFRINRVSD